MEKYKRIAKIKATGYRIANERLFVIERNSGRFIFVYDIRNSELIKTVGYNNGSGLYPLDNYLVDEKFRGVDISTLTEVDLFKDKQYYYASYNDRYIIARDFIGEFEIQYILIQRDSLTELGVLNITGSISVFNSNGLIVSRTLDCIYAYLCNGMFSLSWQLNLIPVFPNAEEKLRISQVKEYQDSILVVTNAGVLRLFLEDGSIIWKTPRYAATLEIVDNVGYVCSGLGLYKINLDTGEESGYGWEYERLPDFKYKGHMYYPDGYRVVYHDGLLWYSVFSSGHSFLLAINPTDGNYEWIHHVDTYDKTAPPQFYGDKMFLQDYGQVLHIYEKEK